MKRILSHLAASVLTLLLLAHVPSALADPPEADARLLRLMKEEPTKGLIMMEVKLTEVGKTTPMGCPSISVDLESDTGTSRTVRTQKSPGLFGRTLDGATYGNTALLTPGNYIVKLVDCEKLVRLRGPFARFTVVSGQIVNLGQLSIVFDLPVSGLIFPSHNKGNWTVGEMSPQAVASLGKLLPAVFSKAKKQYMIPIRKTPQPS
jgi:hypothetical protein